jgi:hypothetical protein
MGCDNGENIARRLQTWHHEKILTRLTAEVTCRSRASAEQQDAGWRHVGAGGDHTQPPHAWLLTVRHYHKPMYLCVCACLHLAIGYSLCAHRGSLAQRKHDSSKLRCYGAFEPMMASVWRHVHASATVADGNNVFAHQTMMRFASRCTMQADGGRKGRASRITRKRRHTCACWGCQAWDVTNHTVDDKGFFTRRWFCASGVLGSRNKKA